MWDALKQLEYLYGKLTVLYNFLNATVKFW
jgi:hypothetical protein